MTADPQLPVVPLLDWFAVAARKLPWREPAAGAWGVLVSEFMLQQTPVVRVLPVYRTWMERWPSPADLAADSPGNAIRAWGRLGYPRRAVRLHAAATAITVGYGGSVPEDVGSLLALPGVGDYTARAVAAFAFVQRVPVVDTNVRRVLNRIVRGTDDAGPATAADRAELDALLPTDPPTAARLSAALMELGAVVCTSARPKCDDCPVRDHCRWLAVGSPVRTIARTTQAWHGTDRQVRGKIMAVVREAVGAVDLSSITPASEADRPQWDTCLASLLADGLLERTGDTVGLPR